MTVEIVSIAGDGAQAPLALLEETLRAGEPLPDAFAGEIRRAISGGELEILAARDTTGETVGVLVLHFRPSVSAAGLFASLEELYVRPEARRRGAGRALVEAAHGRCTARGVSYVEVQTVDEEAREFYAALGYGPEKEVRLLSRSLPLQREEPTGVYRNSSTS